MNCHFQAKEMSRFILFICSVIFSHAVLPIASQATEVNDGEVVVQSESTLSELLTERRASIIRMGDPKYFDLAISNVRSYDVLAATALKGCGDTSWRRFMIDLPSSPSETDPFEIFAGPPLIRYLYQYGECLSALEKKELASKFGKKQNLLGSGTLNQAIIKASSWYLLAQFFPDMIWTEISTNKSYTSDQLMAALKPILISRTKRIFRSGHYEWLSPNYSVLNEYSLLNLIDFAKDKTIKKNAEDEAILEISILRVHSFHGTIVAPLTRKNFDQHNALDKSHGYAPAIAQQLIWYYYGDPSGLGLYDFRSGLGSFFISMLAISPWLPPASVLGLGSPPASYSMSDLSVKAITPEFTTEGNFTAPAIYGDSLITDDFAIGTGNVNFDPYGYSGHIQTFSILLKSNKPYNEIECYQPFWHSSMGEDAWATDRSSPFQQMYRYDDSSVVMLFNTPKVDPWKTTNANRFWQDRSINQDHLIQLVTCRFARDFDEIIQESNWIFVREGTSFVAMGTLRGNNEYNHASSELLKNFTVVKIHEPKTALFFRVDKQTDQLSFEKFRNDVRAMVPNYHPENSSLSLIEKDGVRTEVVFDLHRDTKSKFWSSLPQVIRNGLSVDDDSRFSVRSAEMTLDGGILRIKSRNGELVLAH